MANVDRRIVPIVRTCRMRVDLVVSKISSLWLLRLVIECLYYESIKKKKKKEIAQGHSKKNFYFEITMNSSKLNQ